MSLSAQNAGFTLIELMIVITVLAVFVVVGVPNFQNLIKDNRLSTQANSIISSLQLARSEALKLRTPVSVCRSTDGAACAGAVGAGAWESGWLVFVDGNTAGTAGTIDAGERVIQTVGALGANNTLRATVAALNNFMSYQPNGLQTAGAGDFRLCDGRTPDVNQGRQISISATGRVQSSQATSASPLASCP